MTSTTTLQAIIYLSFAANIAAELLNVFFRRGGTGFRNASEMKQRKTSRDAVKSLIYLISVFVTFPVFLDLFQSYLTEKTDSNVSRWFSSDRAKIACSVVPSLYVFELANTKPGLDLSMHHFPVLVFIPIVLISASSWSPIEYFLLLSEAVLYSQCFSMIFVFFGLHSYGRILPNTHFKGNVFMVASITWTIVVLLTYSLIWEQYAVNSKYLESSRVTWIVGVSFVILFLVTLITITQS